jgi:NAD(P)-dependent dehydrogenase (short-subunit alcohol dehydrogenase family)
MNQLEGTLIGKRALVTGAGSGIGRACAIMLSEAGASVALLGRTADELRAVFDEVGGESRGHLIIEADVAENNSMVSALDRVSAKWESLDILVANAGINGVWAPLDKLEVDEWDKTLEINLRGTFLTVKHALTLLKKNGGSVIVISSINGNRIFSNSGATAYACSKAGQVAFVKMVSLELAADGIRVNVVCPGAVKTQIDDSTERRGIEGLHLPVVFPAGDVPLTQGKPGSADDVAHAVWFLASDISSHISGTEIYVDGGQSLLQG